MVRSLAGVLAAAATLIVGGSSVSAAVAPPGRAPVHTVTQSPPGVPTPPSPPKPASPAEPTIAPAAPASAQGAAVSSEQLGICIGCTRSEAGSGHHLAHATGLKVGDREFAGGESKAGAKQGELFRLPDNPMLALAVGAWLARTADDSAFAQADLVDLAIGKGDVLQLEVLRSASSAEWSQLKSTGHSDSDGVRLVISHQFTLIALHSEANSDGKGHVYLVGINDTHIGDTDDAPRGVIPIDLHPILTVILIQASAAGGVGHTDVGQVTDVGGSNGEALGVLTDTGSGHIPILTSTPVLPPASVSMPSTHGQGGGGSPSVPAAGFALGGAGFLLLLAGLMTLRAAVRRRTA